ncbi:MAG: helix-turn-helix transcriptional regulator [Ruminococcus sp.]|nr:helix-turn-helix transcriptional regulator [Ruminococcus sp.]
MEFKEILKSQRIRAGLTQKELAEKIGVTARTIQNYERGVKPAARFEHVRALANIFGITTDELVGGEIPEAPQSGSFYMNKLVSEVTSMFAGGEISDRDKEAAVMAISQAYWATKNKRKR